ncbi:MAG: alpha/beta fold hydrolase [Pseudomonadota bacterium]|nr:alpha/beta fold hydrolase [Pseudomonadota bacterium]
MAHEEKIVIQGPAGELEGRWQGAQQTELGVLMCHPHPLFHGTMDNKVVTTVTRTASALGLPAVRFNFRGVGHSEGVHDNGRGEQDDVLAVLDYVQRELGWKKVILAGFSFGAGMACLSACRAPDVLAALVLLAPAVHHFDAPNTLPHEFETFVYMGDADEVVPFDEVESWAARVVPTPHFQVFADGSHFFHGRLTDLKASLSDDLAAVIAAYLPA